MAAQHEAHERLRYPARRRPSAAADAVQPRELPPIAGNIALELAARVSKVRRKANHDASLDGIFYGGFPIFRSNQLLALLGIRFLNVPR